MNAYEKIEKLEDKEFKLITGVTIEVFYRILEVLKQKYAKDHAQGGQPGLPVELRLTWALEYWREYRSFRHMANDHQIAKSIINKAVLWVEDAISESEEFKLKDLKERFKPNEEETIKIVMIDVEEQPIERPKHKQEDSYSGKKNDTQQNIKSW
ncbi:MAG: hypothetical protein FWD52_06320 [Candidatus Bathyarchaeota archaeon]|nr:hypothetical protein [Candidatus Termiticorpusculum sp.]